MLNVWCCTSIDSSLRAPQTNGKLFVKFRIYGWKSKYFQKNSKTLFVCTQIAISLHAVGSHIIGETVIPNLTVGDTVSSCIAENTPGDFFPSKAGGWQRCLSKVPLWLCHEFIQSALRKFIKERAFLGEGGAWLERVTVMERWLDPRVV